jgi:hypothetical protein
MSARKAARMAAAIGAGEMAEIEAGHDGIISQPEQVAAVLNRVLTAVAVQRTAQR